MLDRLLTLFARMRPVRSDAAGTIAGPEYFERCATGLLVLTDDGRIRCANPAAGVLLGQPCARLVGAPFDHPLRDGAVIGVPEPQSPAQRMLQLGLGRVSWSGQPATLVSLHDVTELGALQSLKAERVKVLERMAQGASLEEVMGNVVQFVETQHPDAICSVMLLDEEGRRIRHGASRRLPQALIDAFEGQEIGPGRGSCGTAAYRRETVISADIGNDPDWGAWRNLALEHGLRACWSMPIFDNADRVVGTFATYSGQPGRPTAAEIEMVAACAQITGVAIQRERTERQLHLLQTSVANLNDLILITEAEPVVEPGPRILFVNEAFVRRTGYRREEVIGKTPRILQGPLTQRAELDRIRQALQSWSPVRAELINYTKAGETIWLELDITPVADASGYYTHWVAVERDITEYKRAQEILRESEERSRIVTHVTTDAVWDWDLRTDALWWSDGLQALFGYTRAEIETGIESWTRRVHPDDLQRVLAGRQATAASGGERWGDEYRFRKRDGSYAQVLDRAMVIRDADGKAVRMVGGISDVSLRKDAEAAARRLAEVQHLIIRTQREVATSALDLKAVMALIAECAMAITDTAGAAISIKDDDAPVFRVAVGIAAPYLGMRLAASGSLASEAMRTGEAQVSEDTDADPRVDRDACRQIGVRALICAPLLAQGRVVAVLSALSDQPRAFSPTDAAHLQILLDSMGAVVQREHAAEQLRRSESQYRLLFEQNPHPMWVFERSSMRILAVNGAAVARYGYSSEEFLRMTIWDLRPEQEIPRLASELRAGTSGRVHAGLWRHRLKSGEVIEVEISSDDIRFEDRAARLVLANDVTQRVRAERELARLARAQRMLSLCNEAMIRLDGEFALLERVCQILVQEGGYRMAWVGYARDGGDKRIEAVASAGQGVAYLDEIEVSWDEDVPAGRGASGRSIRGRCPVIIADIAREPHYEPWAAHAEKYGFRSTFTLPLVLGDNVFGTLSMYLGESRTPAADEMALLQELAGNLAYGIRARRARQERRRLNQAITTMATAVSASGKGGFFENLVTAMVDAVDADAGFIARLLHEQPAAAQTLSAVVDGKAHPNFRYALAGTPCEIFLSASECVVPDALASRYPQATRLGALDARSFVGKRFDDSQGRPLGMLFVLFRAPLQASDLATSALSVFAARAAAEIERLDSDLRLQEQASLLDHAQDAIVVRDLDNRITYWNRGAERLYGWSFAEVRGRINTENVYEDPAQFQTIIAAVLRDGEWNGRVRQKRRDGKSIVVELHATLVRDDRGQPRSTFAIITDVTQRLAIEERLRRSERLETIGQLTGGVAHDFNNLLTVMLGNTEMLESALHDQPRLREIAAMTREAAQRGAELTHRLLAFARRQALEPRAVHINALIQGLDGLLRRTLGADIELELIRAAGLWDALVDSSQLENALLNLCLNARDAMPAGGRLTIETANVWIDQDYAEENGDVAPGQYVQVAVSDSGQGIPAENLGRVFEPFFTTKPFGKGTGLGLSMVHGFVKQSQGHIKVYSEPGEGTTVKLYLPRAGRAGTAQTGTRAGVGGGRGTETVLLVEDNDLVRAYAEEQLQSLGYRVLVARTSAEALALAEKDASIDLLFTDIIMPGGMNGRKLAEAIRQVRPAIRVLYTSGYTENAIIHHGRLDPGVHLLNKPYSRADLAAKLRVVLGASHEP